MEEGHRDVSQALAGWSEKSPDTRVRWEVLTGNPVLTLAAASREARCLVVGTRGIGGFHRMVLGSTSRGLGHRAHGPSLVVRADGSGHAR